MLRLQSYKSFGLSEQSKKIIELYELPFEGSLTLPVAVLIGFCFTQSSERSNIILFLTDGDPSDSEAGIYQAIEDGQTRMVRLNILLWVTINYTVRTTPDRFFYELYLI